METQLQEKNPNRLKKYVAIVGGIFTCAFAVFGALASIKPSIKADALQYDFEDAVVLTADELNNIEFDEVADYLVDYDLNNTYIIYNNKTYNFTSKNSEHVIYWYNSTGDDLYFNFEGDVVDKGYFQNSSDEKITFTASIYWYGTDIVNAFKESTITLTPTQLNDTTYSYLSEQIEDNYTNQLVNSVIEYNGNFFTFNEYGVDDGKYFYWTNNNLNIYYQITEDSNGIKNKFYIYDSTNDDTLSFIDSITIFNARYIVDNINAPLDTGNFITDLIALLTGGIVPTASAMGTGVSGLVDALAIQGSTMSAFASIIFIFGGITLALALCRWVVNLLSSLGQRNN